MDDEPGGEEILDCGFGLLGFYGGGGVAFGGGEGGWWFW